MNSSPTPTAWATVAVRLDMPASPDAIERLDALGTLVAQDADVGGVERRDAGTLVSAEVPELCVYTTPAAIERLGHAIASFGEQLQLTVHQQVEVHEDDDWRESWKSFYQPQVFGPDAGAGALLLRPSWIERRPDDPALEIVLDPGRAFGTGLHESTRLCLHRLCTLAAQGFVPTSVADLGCGSGILTVAAAKLFPDATLVAIDIDEEATSTTRENAEINGVAARLQLGTGGVQDAPPGPFSLVLANIRPRVLLPGAAAIRSRVAPGGRALLSGILIEEAAQIEATYATLGMSVSTDATPDSLTEGEWRAVELCAP